jgi:hypothetical protein
VNTFFNHEQTSAENFTSDPVNLLKALDALQPSEQQQKNTLFAQAYPGILRAIARKVPQKEILSALSRSGLKLHPVRYREMLAEEHKRRDENGECVCCEACGIALPSAEKPMPASSAESNQPDNNATMSRVLATLKGDKA